MALNVNRIEKEYYSSDTNIYKYSASLKYVLGEKIINIDQMNIKSIAIDSDYKKMKMPMVMLTASVHKDYVDLMEENQNKSIFILSIKRAVANSDMPDLYLDFIEDKFIYFISRSDEVVKEHSENSGASEDADFVDDPGREDIFEIVSLGLLSLDHVNKNKKMMNGIVSGNLSSIMYYATSHLPILIEPPKNNVSFENQVIPPLNSVAKTLEYLNSLAVFYDTKYRFFIDFDCSYLISSSGKHIAKKGETIGTVLITLRNSEDPGSKIQGMVIDKENSMYKIDVDDSDCEISDNHISGKSFSKVIATGTSGNASTKEVADLSESELIAKTKTVRIYNDNTGLLDNMVSSINSSSVQLMIQKADIDSSIITINKEYIFKANDVYDKEKYNGRYLLTRKRELYIKVDESFTMDTMLIFEKIPE